ncbi:hypothetical protein TCAL_14487 [Tigriopus californicus]|uniref:Uncharacterized protein n=1 Tax=Tigriopus californicus TaxID=6832 RepID=A0A553PSQ3_TIGCA|nr:hypothetical protein TCAL_14487 [Tigriopus californicus]
MAREAEESLRFWELDKIIENQTQCYRPCELSQYRLEVPYNSKLSIPRNWIYPNGTRAAFELYFGDTNVALMKEYPTYDGFAFVADVGGILGLFLGFSIFSTLDLFMELLMQLA